MKNADADMEAADCEKYANTAVYCTLPHFEYLRLQRLKLSKHVNVAKGT